MGGGCELGNAVLFRDYPYLTGVAATVLEVDDRGGIILDKTVFYITGGGQPGDSDVLKCAEGAPVEISTAVYGDGDQIVHVPAEGGSEPAAGRAGRAALIGDGDTDTCASGLHVLTVVLPFPVTGGRIGREEAHLDFDIEGPVPSKDEVQYRLNELLVQDRSESSEWITDEELLANPASLRPGRSSLPSARAACGDLDLQPCGGTHVRSTSEIGQLTVAKIENKGRRNRRVRIHLIGG